MKNFVLKKLLKKETTYIDDATMDLDHSLVNQSIILNHSIIES